MCLVLSKQWNGFFAAHDKFLMIVIINLDTWLRKKIKLSCYRIFNLDYIFIKASSFLRYSIILIIIIERNDGENCLMKNS